LSIQARLQDAGLPSLRRPVWLEIDVAALSGNVRAIAARVGPDTAVWPVVKADGYGHGLEVAARAFLAAGAAGVCVASLDEALALRAAGIAGAVLILYPVPVGMMEEAAGHGFQLAVSTIEDATALATRWVASGAAGRGNTLRLHLEIDTGLTRMGIMPGQAGAALDQLAAPGLSIVAVWSHLATPDDAVASTHQEGRLAQAVDAARSRGDTTDHHLAATGGLLTGRGVDAAMVRPGLLAYGVTPAVDIEPPPGIRPAMRIKARAIRIAEIAEGTAVGYGGTWVARRTSRIATLPIGYGDGYPRSMTGAPVLVRGQRAAIVGVVSMDALMVDVTDVAGVSGDDEFVLLGSQSTDVITCLDLAQWRNTIPWEVLTGMARRPTRVYDASVGLLGVRTLAGETLVRDASWS